MPNHPFPLLLASGLAALCAACANPQKPTPAAAAPARTLGGHSLPAFIGAYDLDRDGRVTRSEYDSVRKQRFLAADTNRDGWLSEQEYVAEFEARLKRQYAMDGKQPDERYANSMKQAHVRFRIVDADKNGQFSVEEELIMADKTFRNTDKNGDGVVDLRDGD